MKASSDLSRGIALVWAGVAIGGSLIATPAKFQAPSLSMTTALEVGRAQFFWVGSELVDHLSDLGKCAEGVFLVGRRL